MGPAQPGSIPLQDILAYLAYALGVEDLAERRYWIRLIYAMDDAWLAQEIEKQNQPEVKLTRSPADQLKDAELGKSR